MPFAEPSSVDRDAPGYDAPGPANGPYTEPTTDRPVVVEPADDGVDLSFLDSPLEPGELGRISHYRVLGVLGVGGMGVVLRGEDTHLRRSVALKLMRREYVESYTSRERFLQEARAAAAVESENIVTIYQVGMHNDVPFLAMQYLHGEALDDKLNRQAPLPVPFALLVARQVAAGLADAHAHGLVHRDVKPANIWLEADPASGKFKKAKLLDFGLARILTSNRQLTSTGVIVGTPQYMAPEQAFGNPVDGRADLFSLGAVLYAMLVGELPFNGNTSAAVLMALVSHNPPRVSTRNRSVPREVDDLVARLLAKEPDGRPETAQEVVDILDGVLIEFSAPTLGRTSAVIGYPLRSAAGASTAGGDHGATQLRGATMIAGPQQTLALGIVTAAAAAAAAAVRTPPPVSVVTPPPALPPVFPTVGFTEPPPPPAPPAPPVTVAAPPPRPPRPPRVHRSTLAVWAVLVGLCGYLGYNSFAKQPVGQVRVAVVGAQTGPMAALEQSMADAVHLAIDEQNQKGGVLGRKIVAVDVDGGPTPEEYARQVEGQVRDRTIAAVFGAPAGADRRAVRPVVERHGAALFVAAPHEGMEDSERIVYVGPTASQLAVPAVRYAVGQGLKRVFVLGKDTVQSRAIGAALKDAVTAAGATVVGDAYPPIGAKDFGPVVRAIQDPTPDLIVNTIPGGGTVPFVRQLRAGAGAGRTPVLHLQQIEDLQRAVDPATTAGDLLAGAYLEAGGDGFAARFKARYGVARKVTAAMAGAYTAVMVWAAAAEAAGSLAPDDVLAAVPRTAVDGPFGVLQPAGGRHFRFPLVVARFGPDGNLSAVHREGPLDPDVYPPSRPPQDWDRLLRQLHIGWNDRWQGPEAK